jgi:L-threonylcarbamoyladenylate synthase
MQILNLSGNYSDALKKACEVLNKHGLLVLPSDTVYGLCADANDDVAIKKLIEFKRRPIGKPISVFIPSKEVIGDYVEIPENRNSINKFIPGPFTLVLPSKHKTSSRLESERKTLGVRVPYYAFINDLMKAYKKPITATSANISGHKPHYSVDSLLNTLSTKKKDLLDLIIDAGKLPRNKPSTVVDLSQGNLKIVRKGDITFSNERKTISKTENDTKKIAHDLFDTYKTSKKPLVFLLSGDLGVGKTIVAKAIGAKMGIDTIISPTYVIYYEYESKKGPEKLLHFDLYNLQDEEEIRHLGIEKLIGENSIFVIEWAEKSQAIIELFKDKADIIFVEMTYVGPQEREILISEVTL